ncbi:MAG: 23S rRNA (adenine(2503)-C(2))-methyltransferase RlmN [Puniceicoccales bacterium]|jgi:23S rRNA (adenine2503-C2)-methyltransferase|nr:23S rRNA (adenine(2503)-C(2))-methyltransferase RlmN [Puniceicoccales bacterium]
MKYGILNFSKPSLIKFLSEYNIPKFRADQLFIWLYRFGAQSFFAMSNIGKDLQKTLDDLFYIYRPKIIQAQKSQDGTIKLLLDLSNCEELPKESRIETVFIPDIKRNTICLSSQIGCSVGCKFCNTGSHGFKRNLSTEEIIGQFMIVKDYVGLWNRLPSNDEDRLSNIVFMGMGEPLYNIQNVLEAIEILMEDKEQGVSRRKITISTAGVVPILDTIVKSLNTKLAISLHAPNDEIRNEIMPINRLYNIDSLIKICKKYCQHHSSLRITFEYLMLKNVNDSKKCALELATLLHGINAKVNVIRFNSWPGCEFSESNKKTILNFMDILARNGIDTTIRSRRGRDIMAACGQLQVNL